jgi:predicted ester cyclase
LDIKEFADKYIKAVSEAFQNYKFDLLAEVEASDVVYHTPELVGHEAHKQSIMITPQYCSDIKQEWEYLAGDGNLFALAYKARYISTGKLPGWPPAGKEAGRDAIFLYRLENGKIAEVWQNGSWTGIDVEAMVNALKNR